MEGKTRKKSQQPLDDLNLLKTKTSFMYHKL